MPFRAMLFPCTCSRVKRLRAISGISRPTVSWRSLYQTGISIFSLLEREWTRLEPPSPTFVVQRSYHLQVVAYSLFPLGRCNRCRTFAPLGFFHRDKPPGFRVPSDCGGRVFLGSHALAP